MSGPEEMAQWVNCSLCKPEDLGQSPQNPCKKLAVASPALPINLVPGVEESEVVTGGSPWGLLTR